MGWGGWGGGGGEEGGGWGQGGDGWGDGLVGGARRGGYLEDGLEFVLVPGQPVQVA